MSNQKRYSVGDVVRSKSHNQILEVAEVGTTHYRSKEGHYMSENYIEPFDGFRIGDTVFTVKRGKGKIASKHITKGGHESWKKPFWVLFDDGHETNPKKENLIPTESLYKEALNKTGYAFKIDVAYVHEYVAKPKNEAAERQAEKIAKIKAAGEAFYQAAKNMAAAIGRTTDQIKFPSGGVVYQCPPIPEHLIVSREPIMKFQVAPSAKFKVGDAVYFKNIGHSLCATENPNKYIVENPNAAWGFVTLKRWDNKAAATCRESDLRLWVETKFTHIAIIDNARMGVYNCCHKSPSVFRSVKFVGKNYAGVDVFNCTDMSGNTVIMFGTKGDDIS